MIVFQWLVKQAIASRDERMAAMKQFAGQQFDRKQAFVGAAIEGKEETAKTILETLEHLQVGNCCVNPVYWPFGCLYHMGVRLS